MRAALAKKASSPKKAVTRKMSSWMRAVKKGIQKHADAMAPKLRAYVAAGYSLRYQAKLLTEGGFRTFRLEYGSGKGRGGGKVTAQYVAEMIGRSGLQDSWNAARRSQRARPRASGRYRRRSGA